MLRSFLELGVLSSERDLPELLLLARFLLLPEKILPAPEYMFLLNFSMGAKLFTTAGKLSSNESLRSIFLKFLNTVSINCASTFWLSNNMFTPFMFSSHTTRNFASFITLRAQPNDLPSVCETFSFVEMSVSASIMLITGP